MSEKEKETIEDCKELVQELKQHKDKDFIGRLYYRNKPVEDILSVLLNLIEKQQKEIEHWKAGMKIVERDKNNHIERLEKELDNIKEIEKSHQEENGKLRVELEQEKEKNKELEKYEKAYKLLSYSLNNYISKDKLKFVLSKLNISDIEPWSTYKIDGQILFDLQELL